MKDVEALEKFYVIIGPSNKEILCTWLLKVIGHSNHYAGLDSFLSISVHYDLQHFDKFPRNITTRNISTFLKIATLLSKPLFFKVSPILRGKG